MDRTPIKSSLLSSIGYDAQTKTLEVQFRRGAVYQYEGVEPEIYQEMVQAKSIGSYFLNEIKPAFPCKRMGDEHAASQEEEKQTSPPQSEADPEEE